MAFQKVLTKDLTSGFMSSRINREPSDAAQANNSYTDLLWELNLVDNTYTKGKYGSGGSNNYYVGLITSVPYVNQGHGSGESSAMRGPWYVTYCGTDPNQGTGKYAFTGHVASTDTAKITYYADRIVLRQEMDYMLDRNYVTKYQLGTYYTGVGMWWDSWNRSRSYVEQGKEVPDNTYFISTTYSEIFNNYAYNRATGSYAHAEGYHTYVISSNNAHAEGTLANVSSSANAHAEGNHVSVLSSANAHAEGQSTTIDNAYNAHAEGNTTRVYNGAYSSHAEGTGSYTKGVNAHAENSSYANGMNSHAGGEATAGGNWSFAHGSKGALASGTYSVAFVKGVASGVGAFAQGVGTASGQYTHAEGQGTMATEDYSHAEGNGTLTARIYSHTEGQSTVATGIASHAEGIISRTEGNYSHAEGQSTRSIGIASHAEGYLAYAQGSYSHAEGYLAYAQAAGSHTEGQFTTATGNYSHAEGTGSYVIGLASHAEGWRSYTYNAYEHAQGQWNVSYSASTHNGTIFTIGDGTDAANRHNVVSIFKDGAVGISSKNSTYIDSANDISLRSNTLNLRANTVGENYQNYHLHATTACIKGTDTYIKGSSHTYVGKDAEGGISDSSYILTSTSYIGIKEGNGISVYTNNNYVSNVKGTSTSNVTGASSVSVTGSSTTKIGGTSTVNVEGKSTTTIKGGNETIITNGSTTNITGKNTTTINGANETTVTSNSTTNINGTNTTTVNGLNTSTFKNGNTTTVTGNDYETISGQKGINASNYSVTAGNMSRVYGSTAAGLESNLFAYLKSPDRASVYGQRIFIGRDETANGVIASSIGIGDHIVTTTSKEIGIGSYNKSYANSIFELGVGTSDSNRKNAFITYSNGVTYFDYQPYTYDSYIHSLHNSNYPAFSTTASTSQLKLSYNILYNTLSSTIKDLGNKDNVQSIDSLQRSYTDNTLHYTVGHYDPITKQNTASAKTLQINSATETLAGLLSGADKVRIDDIEDRLNAQVESYAKPTLSVAYIFWEIWDNTQTTRIQTYTNNQNITAEYGTYVRASNVRIKMTLPNPYSDKALKTISTSGSFGTTVPTFSTTSGSPSSYYATVLSMSSTYISPYSGGVTSKNVLPTGQTATSVIQFGLRYLSTKTLPNGKPMVYRINDPDSYDTTSAINFTVNGGYGYIKWYGVLAQSPTEFIAANGSTQMTQAALEAKFTSGKMQRNNSNSKELSGYAAKTDTTSKYFMYVYRAALGTLSKAEVPGADATAWFNTKSPLSFTMTKTTTNMKEQYYVVYSLNENALNGAALTFS